MSNEILLSCWIFGDNACLIRIAKYKTLSKLRVAIKAQNDLSFQHVDTRSIALWKVSKFWWCALMLKIWFSVLSFILWKVSIAFDKSIKKHLDKLNLDDKRPLAVMDKLSSHFSNEPDPNQLHIIVRALAAGEYDCTMTVWLWLTWWVARCAHFANLQ